MNRPLLRWLIFGACLIIVFAAMGWTTSHLLVMERQNVAAARDAEVQERVRLALWRMDSAVSALMIRENALPRHYFRAFHSAEQIYTKTFQAIQQGEALAPSPLLSSPPDHVRLYFAYSPGEGLSSPQVPAGNERDIAESSYVTPAQIAAAEALLQKLRPNIDQILRAAEALGGGSPPEATTPSRIGLIAPPPQEIKMPENAKLFFAGRDSQMGRNNEEWESRDRLFNKALAQQQSRAIAPSQLNFSSLPKQQTALALSSPAPVSLSSRSALSAFAAIWANHELILVRNVANGADRAGIQGVWLNWGGLRGELLREVADLFPSASLEETAFAQQPADPSRLASIPARFVHGETAAPLNLSLAETPLRRSLIIAWMSILAAVAAVAVLMHGAVSLSERRGAFVSAVTHELRTPLTTFRLYADLMAEGDPGEEKRAAYIATLQGEAERLGHLVENVLAYARLERGSSRPPLRQITLGELVEHSRGCLERRASHSGMRLLTDLPSAARSQMVRVNVDAVERILFNLVDNACKYALPKNGEEGLIRLEAGASGPRVFLRVRDHGPGISQSEARKLFRPFQKSAAEAAHSAPGVGLGLSLCRKMSRALGGDLRLERPEGVGACFVLELPAVS